MSQYIPSIPCQSHFCSNHHSIVVNPVDHGRPPLHNHLPQRLVLNPENFPDVIMTTLREAQKLK